MKRNQMNIKVLYVTLVLFMSCIGGVKKKENQVAVNNTSVEEKIIQKDSVDLEVYDFAGFEKFLNKKDDQIYVINFWATWCAPCVKELPYFEKLNEKYKSKQVKVILVSLDFPHLYESKLKPYIKNKNLKSKVIALDDADMNTWIPRVNAKWSGSIPATVIYRNDKREFFEKSFTYQELENEVKSFLN